MSEDFNMSVPDMDDAPIDMENDSLEIMDEEFSPETPKELDGLDAMEATSLKAYNEGTSIAEAFTNIQDEGSALNTKGVLRQNKRDLDKQEIASQFVQDGNPTLESAIITRDLIEKQDTQSPEEGMVEAMSSPEVDVIVADRMASDIKFMRELGKMYEDMSFIEKGVEVASFLLPKTGFDNYQSFGTWFGAEEVVRQQILGFQKLTVEEREEIWPDMVEMYTKDMPKLRAIPLLMKFLDPTGANDLSDVGAFWAALDVVDMATLGTLISAKIGTKLAKLNNVRMLGKLKNIDDAADLNTMVLIEDGTAAATKVGIKKDVAAANALPFRSEDIIVDSVDGISDASVSRIQALEASRKVSTDKIKEGKELLTEDLLNPSERASADEAFEASLTAQGFENVQEIARGKNTTTFSYDLVQDGEVTHKSQEMHLTLNQKTSVFETDKSNVMKNYIASPSVWMRKDRDTVQAAGRMNSFAPNIMHELDGMLGDATEEILKSKNSKQNIAELDHVLLVGDGWVDEATGIHGKEFTVPELRAGIDGLVMNDVQVETYFNFRGVADAMFTLENHIQRTKRAVKGTKQINLSNGAGLGKVYNKASEALSSLNASGVARIWRDDIGRSVSIERLQMDKAYTSGLKMVTLEEPVKFGRKGDIYSTVLVKNWMSQEMPEVILNKRTGYVPKFNKDANWFVKEEVRTFVDGKSTPSISWKGNHYASNKAEAQEVLERLQRETPAAKMQLFQDRELEQQVVGSSGIGSSSGMYTGARSKQPLLFGRDDLPAERFGAFESLIRNVDSVGKNIAINEWRMGLHEKWMNTARSLEVPVESFRSAIPAGTDKGIILQQLRDQIDTWTGVPLKGEQMFQEAARSGFEWATSKSFVGSKQLASGLNKLSDTDPLQAARGAAFHLTLGFLNPAHLFIQAQGAAVTTAVMTTARDPLGGIKALKNQFALHAIQYNSNPAYIAGVAKKSGMATGELTELKRIWDISGLEKSVITSNADYRASAAGFSLTKSMLSRAADTGMFVYRGGELINRRTAVSGAWREYRLQNTGTSPIPDDDIKQILARANDLMLNMQKANAAQWQKGAAGTMTQFQQINAKSFETFTGVNDQFTGLELAKIQLVQLGLYGAGATALGGIGTAAINSVLGLTEDEISEMTPEEAKFYNEGFWGWQALAIFGMDSDISARGSIFNGPADLIIDMLYSDATAPEAVAGVSSTLPGKIWDSFSTMTEFATNIYRDTEYLSIDTALQLARDLGTVMNSWNNLEKGIMLASQDKAIDKLGKTTVEGGFDLGTSIGQMMGFAPSRKAIVFEKSTALQGLKEYKKKVVTALMDNYSDMVRARTGDGSQKEIEKAAARYIAVHKALIRSVKNPKDRRDIVKAWRDATLNADSKEARVARQYIINGGKEIEAGVLNGLEAKLKSRLIVK